MSEISGLTRADARLLADIRSLYDHVDPVPTDVLAAARASLQWREADAVVADITDDITDDTSVPTGDPSHAGSRDARVITFAAADLTIKIKVTAIGQRRRVLGQLVPPVSAPVMVRWPEGCAGCEADEMGRFAVDGVPAGPVSVACNRMGTAPVTTSWVTI